MIHTTKKTYITSDLHLFHGNIVKFCNRHYNIKNNNYKENKEEHQRMIEDILKQFDSLPKGSVIYNLGDVFFLGSSQSELKNIEWVVLMRQIVNRMKDNNKTLILIKGNHDIFENDFYRSLGFDKVYDTPIIVNDNLILSHEPVYISKDSNFMNLYGHTHDIDITDTYFTYENDNARIHNGLPKYPTKIVDTNKYVNCCWDKCKCIMPLN